MTEITLYFPTTPGMDAAEAARALQEGCAKLDAVEAAELDEARPFGVDDIIIVLTVSAKLLTAGALTLEALRRLIDGAKGVAKSLDIHTVSVEGQGRVVDSKDLTEADAKAISRAGG